MVHRENYRILWITWQRDYEVKFCASTLLWYQGRLWTTASLNETCLSIVHYNWISSCRWHVIYFFDAAGTNDGDSIIFEIVRMVCRLCRSRINLSRLTFGDRLIKKKKKKSKVTIGSISTGFWAVKRACILWIVSSSMWVLFSNF